MRFGRAFLLRLASMLHPQRRERELSEEIESNLELHIESNMRAGLPSEEARRLALLKLGGVAAARDRYRDRAGLPALEALFGDLRYALRALLKNPGFAFVAVLTLGLGIGANTAIFSVVRAVLLRPLPYAQPERLVQITETNPLMHWTNTPAAPANFADWQKRNTVFTGIAAYQKGPAFVSGSGDPQRLEAVRCTGNLFRVLGVHALLGRTFKDEETFEGKDRVAILSFDLWQSLFAADPNILGRNIVLSGRSFSVVGVMPRSFFFPNHDIRLYIPLGVPPRFFVENRRPHSLDTIGRLRRGISLGAARGQMQSIASQLERTYPETNIKMGVRLEEFHDTLASADRPALLLLVAAVCALFLIVCSNVANLQLGRAAARSREISIRHALGASRFRLARQILTESLLLSVLGGALGLLLACVTGTFVLRFAPSAVPPFADLRVDSRVVVFDIAIALAAPLLFGIVPALSLSRSENLRDRSEIGERGGTRARSLLVICEIALSVVLVAAAGLLMRSLIGLEQVKSGFEPSHAITFSLVLPEARYPRDPQVVQTFQTIENRLRTLPAVQAVGGATSLALHGFLYTAGATPEGLAPGDYKRELRHDSVTPDYFRAIGARLVAGRFFNRFDTAASPQVTIVNASLEKHYFPGQSALGKRIKFGRPADSEKDAPWVTVVGVVADIKQDGLDKPVQPEAFSPLSQNAQNGLSFVLRGSGNSNALLAEARRRIHSLDNQLVLTDVLSLRDLVRDSVGGQRVRTSLLSGFAIIALFLAALGVYGVLAYSVTQRVKEIGIRLALGASRRQLFQMILRDGMRPVLWGSLLGLLCSFIVTRFLKALLFGIAPTDPLTYASTIAVLLAIAFCACTLPAAKAIRVDPLISLRDQ